MIEVCTKVKTSMFTHYKDIKETKMQKLGWFRALRSFKVIGNIAIG